MAAVRVGQDLGDSSIEASADASVGADCGSDGDCADNGGDESVFCDAGAAAKRKMGMNSAATSNENTRRVPGLIDASSHSRPIGALLAKCIPDRINETVVLGIAHVNRTPTVPNY